jgi:hypothetical protein
MDAGDAAALLERLKAMKEWSRAVIFTDEGHVLASTFSANEAEIKCAGARARCARRRRSALTELPQVAAHRL